MRDNDPERAAIESGGLPGGGRMFEDVNARSILDEVQPRLKDEARSLWFRIDSEFGSGGTGAVTSYLRSQFDEIATGLRAALAAAEDAE